MNAELKQFIQKRNALHSDLTTNHKQWLKTNREISWLTEESRRTTWHRYLDFLKMPSMHGLLCAHFLVGSLTPLESLFCAMVEGTPAVAKVIKTPEK